MIKEKNSTGMLQKMYDQLNDVKILKCIRDGLVMMMPILMVGSIAILVYSLPIPAYQNFISNFLDGALYKLAVFVNKATLGLMGVYFTFSISISYVRLYWAKHTDNYGATITSLICFFILSGVLRPDGKIGALSSAGVFTSFICALGGSSFYCMLANKFRKSMVHLYSDGEDQELSRAISMLFPMTIVVVSFTVISLLMEYLWGVTSLNMLFYNGINKLFSNMGLSLGTMVLFAFLSNFMWFFGVHGDNVLSLISANMLIPAMEANEALIAAGQPATEVYTQTFYNVFVIIGGTGSTISLLLAILIFSKRKNNRKLAAWSSIPMIFNINEIMTFGFPLVLNPIMFIPFVASGVVMVLVSAAAIEIGFVPIPIQSVKWTTPFLLSGYLATGSWRGMLLQFINVLVGILLYCPFIKLYDRQKEREAMQRMDELLHIIKESEETEQPVELLTMNNHAAQTARSIAGDIKFRLERQLPKMYYQPQFDYEGVCVGAEALLRWNHPVYGMIYPPLIIQLAKEAGVLEKLEKSVFHSVMQDMDIILKTIQKDGKVSVNVTGFAIQTEAFELFLKKIKEEYPEKSVRICVEITEQHVLKFDDEFTTRLKRIKEMGYSLAIDDFSMGNTSIKYLQTSEFALVKLDGELSRNVLNNSRSREIIASIAKLTNTFGIDVMAEFVENFQQQKVLQEAGCNLYQGYLYSPAVPVEDFEANSGRFEEVNE